MISLGDTACSFDSVHVQKENVINGRISYCEYWVNRI